MVYNQDMHFDKAAFAPKVHITPCWLTMNGHEINVWLNLWLSRIRENLVVRLGLKWEISRMTTSVRLSPKLR